jgi:hypothetical protein
MPGEPFVVNTDAWCIIPDGFEESGLWLVEIKTLSHFSYETQDQWRHGIVPPSYECQCRLYNHFWPNAKGVIICCAWGLDDDCRAHVFIPRDEEKEKELIRKGIEFAESVAHGEEPETIEIVEGGFDIPDKLSQQFRDMILDYHSLELAQADLKEDLKGLAVDNDKLFEIGDKGTAKIHVKSEAGHEWDDRIYFSRKVKNEKPSYYVSLKCGAEKSIGISL